MDLESISAAVAEKLTWLYETLRQLVLIESPTEDPAAVNQAMTFVAEVTRNLGGRVKLHRQKHFGDIHELRFGPLRTTQKPLLLLGHLDTVWPLGTLEQMPWRNETAASTVPASST